ncbi:MAG: hypothetical protein ACWA49_01150 [Ruegeria sp.]
MKRFIKRFGARDDGAVTVDWVVLTATLVALSGFAYFAIQGGVDGMGSNFNSALSGSTVSTGTNNDPNAGFVAAGTAGGN